MELFGDLDPLRLGAILLVVLGAAVVKGALGFGFPLVAAPLISAIWDPRHAVLLLSIASLLNNIGIAARGGGDRATFRRLAPTIGGLIVGVLGGALLLASLDARLLGAVVGGAAVAFAIVALVKPDLAVPPRLERYLALPMGLAGGLLGGSTSIFAPALASYTHALQLGKREFVFYLTVMYTIGGIVQVAAYVRLDLYDLATLAVAAVSCVPNLLGVNLGLRIQDKIDPALFRRLVVILIAATGASLVVRAFWP